MNEERRTLLDLIRARPPLYLGESSLTGLWHFIIGFQTALGTYGLEDTENLDIPREFHEWVAYRLHYKESTSGWRNMILERTASEADALSRFFELLDEFRSKTPRLVAKLVGHQRTSIVISNGVTTECHFPESVSLITYTDDPGFFVRSDVPNVPPCEYPFGFSESFFPCIEWFESGTNASRDKLTIIDEHWNFGIIEGRSEPGGSAS